MRTFTTAPSGHVWSRIRTWPARVDRGAGLRRDLVAQQAPDVCDQARIGLPHALDQLRGALDIGKEEGHGPGRKLSHARGVYGCRGTLTRTAQRCSIRGAVGIV